MSCRGFICVCVCVCVCMCMCVCVCMVVCHQILPVDGMNINQINIKEAVAAGCAARGLSGASALPASAGLGLNALRDKGASAAQLNEYGESAGHKLRCAHAGTQPSNASILTFESA